MSRIIHAADLFCGAGGSSNGLYDACSDLGLTPRLLAVNHWPLAVETHRTNHPDATHLCETLDSVDPRKVVPGGKLNILIASPECTHHSNARGGVPMSDQSRASAWHVLRWAEALQVERILVENVREFMKWGPLGANGRPIKSREGETFRAWVNALESLNYTIQFEVVNCADYGDPQERKRFFLAAVKGRRSFTWPAKTHADPKKNEDSLFGGALHPWVPASRIIDWSMHGSSIFGRKRPLSKNTIDRIATGIKKFWGEWAEPFLVMLYGTGGARSVKLPLPTVTGGGQHIGLVQPFVVPQFSSGNPREVGRPLGAITTTSRGVGLVEPFVIATGGPTGSARPRACSQPMKTVLAENRYGVVQPFIVNAGGPEIAPRSVNSPMNTVLTRDHVGVVQPFITKFYGTGGAASIDEPLDTITAKDRFGLVTPTQGDSGEPRSVQLDIMFRMLQPHELAAAMSFPKDYRFEGNRSEQVRQIGNAVPRMTARALCRALLAA